MDNYVISIASNKDNDVLFELVNEAYKVEDGDTGVGFKKTNRFIDHSEINAYLPCDQEHAILVALRRAAQPQRVIDGCIFIEKARKNVAMFGPLAVSPAAQGAGLGSFLIGMAEQWACEHECPVMEIFVVNHRTDLIPYYSNRGYKQIRTEPFIDPDRLARDAHFLVFRKQLLNFETESVATSVGAGSAVSEQG
eukprot:TRINITY_DN15551_c0_g1_i1.p1 TRINITY_DN15551_c0_g1~~TRINITY_DN15551_c0_g1_i1.p1  ORF type:complete len:204 (-),score=32.83 TRINITY_DN15551_c0_g1_i1:109-690(-)